MLDRININAINIIFLLFFCNGHLFSIVDYQDSRLIVENYIETMEAYCENYDETYRFFMVNHLLDNQNINIGNDLNGYVNQNYQANWYYIDLKNERAIISYNPNFQLINCLSSEGDGFVCAFVKKNIIYKNGQIQKFNELIELKKRDNGIWKIASIASELFSNIESYVEETKKNDNSNSDNQTNSICDVEKLANQAYEDENYELALKLYAQAKKCTANEEYISGKINELKERNQLGNLFKLAESQFLTSDYEKALSSYQAILNLEIVDFEDVNIDLIGKRIAKCKDEIEVKRLIQDAEFHFSNGNFNKAHVLYEEVLKYRPNDSIIQSKLIECEGDAIEERLQNDLASIQYAERLIKDGKLDEGFSILLKKRNSNLLSHKHFFLMAQILDPRPKAIKKEYGMTNKDFCVLTKQFMIQARSLGANSKGFNFFWETHFNKKSRQCIH